MENRRQRNPIIPAALNAILACRDSCEQFASSLKTKVAVFTVKFDTENGGQLSVKDLHKLLPDEQSGDD